MEQQVWSVTTRQTINLATSAEGSERTWMGRNRSKTGRKTLRITASRYREILHETLLRGQRRRCPP